MHLQLFSVRLRTQHFEKTSVFLNDEIWKGCFVCWHAKIYAFLERTYLSRKYKVYVKSNVFSRWRRNYRFQKPFSRSTCLFLQNFSLNANAGPPDWHPFVHLLKLTRASADANLAILFREDRDILWYIPPPRRSYSYPQFSRNAKRLALGFTGADLSCRKE